MSGSGGESGGSMDSATPSRQVRGVQFGITPIPPDEESLHGAETGSEASEEEVDENVNERLRHQMPQVQEYFMEMKHLDKIMASVSIVIIQQCYGKIKILRKMYSNATVAINLDYVPLDEKYNNADYDMETIINTSQDFLEFKKFKEDICWIEKILQTVIINLQKDFYYDEFLKILNNEAMTRQEEQTLLGSKEFNRKELAKLKSYIEEEKKMWTKAIQETTEDLGNTKDQLNDDLSEFVVKINYLKEWENARHEQNKMILDNKENKLTETRQVMDMETEKEERVHEEMWLYLENSLQEYKSEIEEWMDKYDKDLDEKEQQVEAIKIDLHNQEEDYNKLLDKYNERQKEMDEWKEYKLQKQKEAEELERRTNAAVKIQSWWRGIMFRKGLGPFRRRKGKGKKGSGRNSGKKGSAKKRNKS